MKLRLRENSIRLRLLQSEVKTLQETGKISEQITFPANQKLIYTIEILENSREISADLSANEIVVRVSRETAQNWFETDLISLENEQRIGGDKILKILIEKDFVCLDRPFDADNADAFPNPKMMC